MRAIPIELKDANNFVNDLHRHHIPVHRDKYRIGCEADDGHLCGVIQVGRPVNRILDNGETLEVLRCCTDGERNACSFLYSKAARIAKEMGYKKIITYILENESGSSLRAAGWQKEADLVGGGSWNTPSRRRQVEITQLSFLPQKEEKYPICKKQRYSRTL